MSDEIREFRRIAYAAVVLSATIALPAQAQQSPIVYPGAGQSMEQQGRDETECRNWATQNTGFSPYSTPPEYYSGAPQTPGVVGGAARGAAVGAVGGAIAGDAGKGAAIGAAAGGTLGLLRRGQERRQQANANSQAMAAYQADMGRYNQAFAACMSGKNYVVR